MASLGFGETIEQQAVVQIHAWRQAHASAVATMPRALRDLIEPLWYVGTSPMQPTTVEARPVYAAATERVSGTSTVPIKTYKHHLYVIPSGMPNSGEFPVDTSRSSWEAEVLAQELTSRTLVGWYRNPSSGRHALAIPYDFGDKTLLMHPDFLLWHDDGDGQYVLDIVDPHRHDLADTAPKWQALANYAREHSTHVRRVQAIIRNASGVMRALDLTADGVAERIGAATNKELVEALFASEGVNY
jgi:type III restriction enzyme